MESIKKEEAKTAPSLLFEGMTSIRSVISAPPYSTRRIITLYIDEDKRKSKAKEIGWLSAKSRELSFEIKFVDHSEIDSMTLGSTHGGIAALCTDRLIPELNTDNCGELIRKNGFYVMLEGIEDPYNFGYALRSVYACGADGVILSPRNWMSAAGVVCRSSAGASELLPVLVCDPCRSADIMRSLGYKVLCAGIRNSVSSFECDMTKPIYLIVGGEKRGISSSLLAKADKIVRIDYGREFGGSLSAASASAMLAYEVLRQNPQK